MIRGVIDDLMSLWQDRCMIRNAIHIPFLIWSVT